MRPAENAPTLSRRQFLAISAALTSGLYPLRAFGAKDHRYEHIRTIGDFDQLPWFETVDGKLRLKSEADCGVPDILDMHAHVGWSYAPGAKVDQSDSSQPVKYFYDYKKTPQRILYDENHPWLQEGLAIEKDIYLSLFRLSEYNKTHTAASLVLEMERMRHTQSCLMPIRNFFVRSHVKETLKAHDLFPKQFIPFGAVSLHAWSRKKEKQLDKQLERGIRGVKFHPEFQYRRADKRPAKRLFEWCAANNVPVLAHIGYTANQPTGLKEKADPETFKDMLKDKRLRVIFGHAGLIAYEEVLALIDKAGAEERVWLETSGQDADTLEFIIDHYRHDRIVYGSDWPFYPLAVSLARVLAATEDKPQLRRAILHDNAAALLGV